CTVKRPLSTLLLPYRRYCAACPASATTGNGDLPTDDVARNKAPPLIPHRDVPLRRDGTLPCGISRQPAGKLGSPVLDRQRAWYRNWRSTHFPATARRV